MVDKFIVPNDGSFLGTQKAIAKRNAKVKEEFDKAWKSQKDILKNSLVKLYKDKNSLGVQWTSMHHWDDTLISTPNRVKRSLTQLGKGKFGHNADSVNRAIAIAQEIDLKIRANAFSWKDYPQWLPNEFKPIVKEKIKQKTIAEWIEEYERDYWSTRSQDKTSKQYFRDERNWRDGYLRYLKFIKNWNACIDESILNKACLSYPKSWKKNECCTRIKYFAHFCGLSNYDNNEYRISRKQVEVKAKPKKRLTDDEIEEWYNKFSEWEGGNAKKSYWQLWQWMYGMQAAYGFRNHEVLNIFNMTEKYLGEDGTWYYPFTDAIANPRGIIYTEGKGIKRSAFLPQPRHWLDRFNLRTPPQEYFDFTNEISKSSKYEQEKQKTRKLLSYTRFLANHDFTFTAYNLRHAHNVKMHGLGIPISLIAKNLGHSIQMNQSVYLSSQDLQSCLNAIDHWEQSRTDREKDQLSLETRLELLQQENEQLKALIQSLLENLKKDTSQKEEE
jgi:hypothetical protein